MTMQTERETKTKRKGGGKQGPLPCCREVVGRAIIQLVMPYAGTPVPLTPLRAPARGSEYTM